MTNQELMSQVFEAFSTLSDAQEMIARGNDEQANELINHAKLHLLKAQTFDFRAYRMAMVEMAFSGCKLTYDEVVDELHQAAERA